MRMNILIYFTLTLWKICLIPIMFRNKSSASSLCMKFTCLILFDLPKIKPFFSCRVRNYLEFSVFSVPSSFIPLSCYPMPQIYFFQQKILWFAPLLYCAPLWINNIYIIYEFHSFYISSYMLCCTLHCKVLTNLFHSPPLKSLQPSVCTKGTHAHSE